MRALSVYCGLASRKGSSMLGGRGGGGLKWADLLRSREMVAVRLIRGVFAENIYAV